MYRFYSRPDRPNRVSVVGQYDSGQLKIAVSRCSGKDAFVRKRGRAIAESRLIKGMLYRKINLPMCDIKTFVEVAKGIAQEVENRL